MVLIAIRPLEVVSVDNPHVVINEHRALLLGWNGHERLQASEGLPSTILEVNWQVNVPALECSVHLWHCDLAWDHGMPAGMNQECPACKTHCTSQEPKT